MSVDTQYTVFGMTCEDCVRTVTDAFTELPGVEQVAVDLPSGQVTVRSAHELSRSQVAAALEAAGYELAGHQTTR